VNAIPLGKLLEQGQVSPLLATISALDPSEARMAVADICGRWIAAHPEPPDDHELVRRACSSGAETVDAGGLVIPLIVEGIVYGALYCDRTGERSARVLHQILTLLVQQALILKSLAKETLDRYREINLLYRVHETIGACLDLNEVIRRVLQESVRITKANGGSVLLFEGSNRKLETYDSVGVDVTSAERALAGQMLSQKVFQSGKPQIMNDLKCQVDPRNAREFPALSLLSAPLKSGDQILGVITLARVQAGTMFTAGDQKVLAALASQAGTAIANAREVQAREQKLREQIEDLRIEIDDAKKQREVFAITENEYFAYLRENAQRMRAEFDV
jgi:hypothetical protein